MSKPWPHVPLGEIAEPVARPVKVLPGESYRTLGVKWWGEGAYERETIDGSRTAAKTLSLVETDDLIINKIWVRHGSTAIVCAEVDGCVASGEFPTFRLNRERVVPRWLHWLTKTRGFWLKCEALSRGSSGKNRIKPELFLTIPVPLPSLLEQRRILAQIEELSAQIHEAQSLRSRAIAEASALEKTASNKSFRAVSKTEALGKLIAEGSTISYGVLVPGPEVEDGVPFIRIQDLSVRNPPARPAKRISLVAEKPYARTRLKGGEVLLAVVGATIGKVGVVPDGWRGANIARAVCRIVPGASLDREFLVHALQSQQVQEYFRTATRTLAQPTLNVGQLEQAQIPLPSLPEQRRIVAELDALQTQVDELKRLQSETAAELDAMLPALLDRAFRQQL